MTSTDIDVEDWDTGNFSDDEPIVAASSSSSTNAELKKVREEDDAARHDNVPTTPVAAFKPPRKIPGAPKKKRTKRSKEEASDDDDDFSGTVYDDDAPVTVVPDPPVAVTKSVEGDDDSDSSPSYGDASQLADGSDDDGTDDDVTDDEMSLRDEEPESLLSDELDLNDEVALKATEYKIGKRTWYLSTTGVPVTPPATFEHTSGRGRAIYDLLLQVIFPDGPDEKPSTDAIYCYSPDASGKDTGFLEYVSWVVDADGKKKAYQLPIKILEMMGNYRIRVVRDAMTKNRKKRKAHGEDVQSGRICNKDILQMLKVRHNRLNSSTSDGAKKPAIPDRQFYRLCHTTFHDKPHKYLPLRFHSKKKKPITVKDAVAEATSEPTLSPRKKRKRDDDDDGGDTTITDAIITATMLKKKKKKKSSKCAPTTKKSVKHTSTKTTKKKGKTTQTTTKTWKHLQFRNPRGRAAATALKRVEGPLACAFKAIHEESVAMAKKCSGALEDGHTASTRLGKIMFPYKTVTAANLLKPGYVSLKDTRLALIFMLAHQGGFVQAAVDKIANIPDPEDEEEEDDDTNDIF